jgi:alpha-beta hydrolase superfamily lysophospholipase
MEISAADGTRLAATRLSGPPDARASVVLVHGLMHSSRNPRIHAFAHRLARGAHVLVPDLRGHGASGGVCTLGNKEPLDVDAAVRVAASAGLPVVTVGTSLGGASVLLHAGTFGGVAGAVGISSPAWWGAWDTPSTSRIHRYVSTPAGRWFLAHLMRTRLADRCDAVPDARDVVASIAPAFTLVVHDPDDHYFGEAHARTIFEWARHPKDLWWVRGGHATDILTPALADRLLDEIAARVGG